MTAYLLDTNVFIEAKNRYYGFDFCPAFWDWVLKMNRQGKVYSIEKVSDELISYKDELSDWASDMDDGFFLPPDQEMNRSFGTVSSWIMSQDYTQSAKNIFMQDADYYLISYAHAHDHVVVTHEIPSSGMKKVKIPNVCIGLGIKCINPFEMLRTNRARFVLEKGT